MMCARTLLPCTATRYNCARQLGPAARGCNPACTCSQAQRSTCKGAHRLDPRAGYNVSIMLGSAAPGHPAWQVDTAVISELFHKSLNFFHVSVVAHAAGITLIPCIPEHPVSEALLNFVAARVFLVLPSWPPTVPAAALCAGSCGGEGSCCLQTSFLCRIWRFMRCQRRTHHTLPPPSAPPHPSPRLRQRQVRRPFWKVPLQHALQRQRSLQRRRAGLPRGVLSGGPRCFLRGSLSGLGGRRSTRVRRRASTDSTCGTSVCEGASLLRIRRRHGT
jgi:hypothetical protein